MLITDTSSQDADGVTTGKRQGMTGGLLEDSDLLEFSMVEEKGTSDPVATKYFWVTEPRVILIL